MSEQIPLSTIAEINPHRGKLPTDIDEASFIAMADVSDTAQWVSRQTRQVKDVKNGYTFFREGDVLVAKITPCLENGKGCHATGLKNAIGFGSTEFHVLRARGNADAAFIFQLTNYKELRQQAAMKMTGSAGQQRVPAQFIADYPVHPFTKLQQSKIAQVLSTLDRAIAQTESLLVKQQKVKAGLMQELLTRGIDADGNRRDPRTHAFKDCPLGPIPVEWEAAPVSAFATVSGGKRLPEGHQYAQYHTGYQYLRVVDFYKRNIDFALLENLEAKTFEALNRYEIRSGDLYISIAGSLGFVGLLTVHYSDRFILTENAAKIRIDREQYIPDFLALMMNSNLVQSQIEAEIGTGGGVPKLALFRIKSLVVLRPGVSEQQQIVSVIDKATREEHILNKQYAKMQLLKAGLMQDLLTGRVSVLPLMGESV